MKSKVLMIVLIFTSFILFAQNQEKIYYDNEWKGCSQNNAAYYRIALFDLNNQTIGVIKDYFITGELQGEADSALKIDKQNDTNSIFIGKVVGYYKNGNKKFEDFRSKLGHSISLKEYYENGKLHRLSNFKDDKLADKFYIECDEFGKCQKVFYESFSNEDNENNWQLISNSSECKSTIIAEKGLLMENKSRHGFKQTINIPLSLTEDFSIATSINFKYGEKNSGHGLIWGYKDWDNYFFFYISANGHYRIGARTEGVDLEFVKWTQTNYLNQDYSKNLIKILRVNDKMYFIINGNIVYSNDFYSFEGNNIGFLILSGEKEVLFEDLIVKQDIDNNVSEDYILSSGLNTWKGNGTGFFINTNGYIATNYHVIADASIIEIEFNRDGQKQNHKAIVIQVDKQNDLAILKVDDKLFRPFISVPYNFQTSLIEVGSNVFALGYPMALSIMGSEIKFTDGKISSKTGFQGDISTYQMSTPVQPGNSGGPLFDFDGNLIGINSSKIRADLADNVSYAIKSSYLKNLIDVLPSKLVLPNDKSIMNKTLIEKIKIISDYVVLIKVK